MSRRSKGARLKLRKASRGRSAYWAIIDGECEESTRCGEADIAGAEKRLSEYLARKHVEGVASASDPKDPRNIPIADVIALYARNVAPKHAAPKETVSRLGLLLNFFGEKVLGDVNGGLCRAYVCHRSTTQAARRELEDLRAAINYHRKEGKCTQVVEVVLPKKSPPRVNWITRQEAARLIRSAWRCQEEQAGSRTRRYTRRHVAKFILVALYTGTRAGAVCGAAFQSMPHRGWIDLERGVFYRKPPGASQTKKRQTPVPLPRRLLAHLRRWRRLGQNYVVEWNGRPIKRITKAFDRAVVDARLPATTTPHTLRHTAATWLMQAGTDRWEAAGYLGMTVQTLEDNYGHHHPEHLEGARDAFDRRRKVT